MGPNYIVCRLFVAVTRRRLTFGGVRRRRYADRKAELPLIAAYSDVALRTRRRLDGHDDTGDESDCTGDLRLYYDCERPLHCYQVRRLIRLSGRTYQLSYA